VKVLSMIQPWATLLVLRESKYETRTWKTKYRGPLAIHTSQKTDKQACREEPYQSILHQHGYTEKTLPTGVIIATCNLTNCYQVIDDMETAALLENGEIVDGHDYIMSGCTVGEYVWEVTDMQILPTFIPAKGKLGLWEHPLQ
jgi:activating signal cointegrator 1